MLNSVICCDKIDFILLYKKNQNHTLFIHLGITDDILMHVNYLLLLYMMYIV